jgi:hypothetical protein
VQSHVLGSDNQYLPFLFIGTITLASVNQYVLSLHSLPNTHLLFICSFPYQVRKAIKSILASDTPSNDDAKVAAVADLLRAKQSEYSAAVGKSDAAFDAQRAASLRARGAGVGDIADNAMSISAASPTTVTTTTTMKSESAAAMIAPTVSGSGGVFASINATPTTVMPTMVVPTVSETGGVFAQVRQHQASLQSHVHVHAAQTQQTTTLQSMQTSTETTTAAQTAAALALDVVPSLTATLSTQAQPSLSLASSSSSSPSSATAASVSPSS